MRIWPKMSSTPTALQVSATTAWPMVICLGPQIWPLYKFPFYIHVLPWEANLCKRSLKCEEAILTCLFECFALAWKILDWGPFTLITADQGISLTASSNPCTLQTKSSSQSIFESQLPFTLSIFKAMKDWLRLNHPLYLIHKFKAFKVMFMSLNNIYIYIYLAHPLFIITSDLNFPYNQTIVTCITNQHEGRQVNTSCNFNISYIFLSFVMATKTVRNDWQISSWVLLHYVCISD